MPLDLNKLAAAKLWLISTPNTPGDAGGPRGLTYLAHAVYALIVIESSKVSRIACDEFWRVYLNPTWFDAATVPEIAEELAHVTWHLLVDHASRALGVGVDRTTAEHWSRAADIAVAHALDADDVRPARLPTAASVGLADGRSAEEYYASLSGLPATMAEPNGTPLTTPGCGSGADGILRSHELGAAGDVGAITEIGGRSIRERVAIEYRDHVTARGSDPGHALRWVREVLEPNTPWEEILRASVRRAIAWTSGRGQYTYSRPSRRASSVPHVVLAGQHRPSPRASSIIDTSASVDDRLLARALGELEAIISSSGAAGAGLTVYSVDAAVHATGNVRSALDAKLIGAGGTDLRMGLAAVAAERPRPDVVVVLTDGDTPWPEDPPPGTVVIVALLGRSDAALPPTPDWVLRVECRLEN